MSISVAERYCEIMLASATPSAAILHTITKNKLRITLSTPAAVRYTSGRRVSPSALRTALPKLNIPSAGIPRAYILKYSTAPSISSSFVFINASMGCAKKKHATAISTPAAVHSTNAVCTVSEVSFFSPAPMNCATRTFTPLPIPISTPVNSVTSIVVDPTEPRACELEKLPTTATSAILNSTCKSCDAISGTLNRKMFLYNDPSVIVMPPARAESDLDMKIEPLFAS